MSAAPSLPPDFYEPPEDRLPQEPPRRPLWKRVLLWTAIALALILLLIVGGIEFVLHNSRAHQYILQTAEQKVTDALGSQVKVGNYALNFSGISPTLDLYNVTIAGAAPYVEPPVLQVDHIRVGVRVVSLLSKKWYLDDVTVDHPIARVFVDKDGHDNLPKGKSSDQGSSTNLFDLAVRHALLGRGEVYYNDHKSLLTADLHEVDFKSSFDAARPRYYGTLGYTNGHLQMENFDTIEHDFRSEFEYAPDRFSLRNAQLRSGSSHITTNATLWDIATQPKLQADYVAVLATGEFRRITKNPTLPTGEVDLTGKVEYTSDPKRPMLEMLAVHGSLASKSLQARTPDFHGEIRNLGANYAFENGNLDIRQLHATLLGGDLNGSFSMRNVAGDSASHLTATIRGASLGGLKTMITVPAMEKIGIAGTLNADADAKWGKSLNDLVAVTNANLKANVTPPQGNGQNVPVQGVIHARYNGAGQQVTLTDSYFQLPQAALNLNGTVSRNSALQVRLQANDLHELEAVAAMFETNAQPLGLYGTATFNGAVTGSTSAPHLTGQLSASNLQVKGSSWRDLRTNVDVSPSQASFRNGELDPAERGRISFDLTAGLNHWSFTKTSPFTVALNGSQLNVENLTKAAGVQAPVTGTLSLNVQAHGTQLNPVGNGNIELSQGKVAGETVQLATVKFQGNGDTVHTTLAFRIPAGSANGTADYFPKQQGYDAKLQANGIRLEQLQSVKAQNLQLTGVVNVSASGKGTLNDPQLVASVTVPQLAVQGQTIQNIKLQANVANHVADVSLDSQAVNTSIRGRGRINLTGDYETVAALDTQSIPLAPLIAAYAPAQAGNITGQTELHANLRGPLKRKAAIEAHVNIPTLALNYKNAVQIGAAQPIQIDYNNGVLNLQRATLRGTGTDLQIQGRVPMTDTSAPISLLVQGTVDLRLAEILNPDLASSGQLQFDINSYGQRSDPNIQGSIKVVNATLATGDAPLGLQNGNGVLTLTRNRLEVTQFEGTVGGGRVVLRGGATYRPTIGFDLAMTARGIRLLYPDNIRSGIGANLTLSGTPETAYLRGQINLQQLSFTPDFDLMELMGQFGGTTSPPPSQGFTSDLQLDMKVISPQGINLVSRELSLEGGLNLNIRGTAADPVILGRVNLSTGDLIFRGNRYLLQGATIDFVNPVRTEPVVNASINTTVQQYNIAMRFEGPIDHLRTNYTADPSLPPADIINLLAFGKTTEAAAANPNPPGNLGAESAIASAVSGQVTSRLEKIAGISQLSINPTLGGSGSSGQNPGATVTIQQRVTSKIFVTFSTDVTSTERQVIQLEYQVSPRFAVSATRDQNGGFAMDTRIKKSW